MTNPYRLTLKIEANGEESDFRLVRVENAEDLKEMVDEIQSKIDEIRNAMNMLFEVPA
jgi:hypothetical protein